VVAQAIGLATALRNNPLQYSTIPQYPPPFYSSKVICVLRGEVPTLWDPVLGLWLSVTGGSATGVSNSDQVVKLPLNWDDFIPYTPQRIPTVVRTDIPQNDYSVGSLNPAKFREVGAPKSVMSIVENGVYTGVSGPRVRNRRHDRTVLENMDFTEKLLDKMTACGLLEWVDKQPMACFPLKFAPKESGDPRLCVDMRKLKYRLEKKSVMQRPLEAIEQKFVSQCWYLKYDLKNGYWHIKWDEKEKMWNGGRFRGRYFVWPVALMGHPHSPYYFDVVMAELERHFVYNLQLVVERVVDDFLFVFDDYQKALTASRLIESEFAEFGLRLNLDKCIRQPVQEVEFRGYIWNSIHGTVGVKQKFLTVLSSLADRWNGRWMCGRDICRVMGLVNYLSFVRPAVMSKVSGLINIQKNVSKYDRWEEMFYCGVLSRELREVVRMTVPRRWRSVCHIPVWSDSSDTGLGIVTQGHGVGMHWSGEMLSARIETKELVAAVKSIIVNFGESQGINIGLFVDNTAVVSWINKRREHKNEFRNYVVQILDLFLFERDLQMYCHWIPSEQNPADPYSRM
jgi:hypothetical protein